MPLDHAPAANEVNIRDPRPGLIFTDKATAPLLCLLARSFLSFPPLLLSPSSIPFHVVPSLSCPRDRGATGPEGYWIRASCRCLHVEYKVLSLLTPTLQRFGF